MSGKVDALMDEAQLAQTRARMALETAEECERKQDEFASALNAALARAARIRAQAYSRFALRCQATAEALRTEVTA